MEKAILLNRLEDFKYLKKEHERVYFGNEFCARLLPDKKELSKIIEKAKRNGLKFTFLTSQAGSEDLKIIKNLFHFLNKKKFLKEVVVNDYGVLNYLNKNFPGCEAVFGRMLSYFSSGSDKSYLNKIGVKRFEFDDVGHIYKRRFQNLSFYYPYALFFNTRYCPMTEQGIISCSKECMKIGELKMKSPAIKEETILFGNAHFLKKKLDGKVFKNKNITRLVFVPKVPL